MVSQKERLSSKHPFGTTKQKEAKEKTPSNGRVRVRGAVIHKTPWRDFGRHSPAGGRAPPYPGSGGGRVGLCLTTNGSVRQRLTDTFGSGCSSRAKRRVSCQSRPSQFAAAPNGCPTHVCSELSDGYLEGFSHMRCTPPSRCPGGLFLASGRHVELRKKARCPQSCAVPLDRRSPCDPQIAADPTPAP